MHVIAAINLLNATDHINDSNVVNTVNIDIAESASPLGQMVCHIALYCRLDCLLTLYQGCQNFLLEVVEGY